MPLIIICGLPCVGKTRFANQLAEYFKSKDRKVELVNEGEWPYKINTYYIFVKI